MREDEILDHLDLMLDSIELIEKRFSKIRLAEDFVISLDGVTLVETSASFEARTAPRSYPTVEGAG